jgi:hypothetical protein
MFRIFLNINSISYSFRRIANQNGVQTVDIQTVHHILKNTAVQNVNKPFDYITDLTSTSVTIFLNGQIIIDILPVNHI